MNKVCCFIHSEESRIGDMMKIPSHENSALNMAVENNPKANKGSLKDMK